ncbi:MAG: hypothetical protein ACLUD0_10450 [Eubacterium ramulus]
MIGKDNNVEAARSGMQSMLFTEDYESLQARLCRKTPNAGIETYQQKKTIRKKR